MFLDEQPGRDYIRKRRSKSTVRVASHGRKETIQKGAWYSASGAGSGFTKCVNTSLQMY